MSLVASVSRRAFVGLLLVAAIVTAGLLVSPAAMAGFLESLAADPGLFALTVAGLYLVRPLFAWPTTPLSIVVGYGYGIALGVPIAIVGVVVTVVPVFLAARWFVASNGSSATADSSLETAWGPLDRISGAVTRYYRTTGPIRGVTVSRLAPIPSDVSTCAAALSGVKLRHLVVGTALGELPWTIAGVVVGASAATITTDGFGGLGLALTLACGVAATLLLAGPAYRVVRSRTQTPETGRPGDA
ncbi:TVP38/TMEM64 family protein [Natrarchaeobius halalkaliphilus]|uniref:TVP38/TMEM64 family protein n=1 Tax=Natrarchaeobius halalkaliphilus TaxID=1679091 RepID=A0A3N6LP04_9EURY|nr:VTT domain-containing protein [Natrarchaeobius halalkaliphilus]RQG91148.1 TVP38/TMEM64 family protein [Natrarchaeobius halalkaliphilus]